MKRQIMFLLYCGIVGISFLCNETFGLWEDWGFGKPSEKTDAKLVKQTSEITTKFKEFKYIDKQGIGIEAFHMLIPSDWQFEGGITWTFDNPGMPAVASFRVGKAKGTEEFEVFPNQPFFWTNNTMVLSMFPQGSRYFGNEVSEPMPPLDALKTVVIPRFRGNVSNLRIGEGKTLPELAQGLGAATQTYPGISMSAEGGKIRMEYHRDGKWIEEEIYCVVESASYSMQTMMGMVTNINWIVDYIFSFKAEKGKLDANTKTFQTIIHSFKLNPLWFSKYNQVIEYLAKQQIQQIQNIGQLSRIVSQTNNEISDMIMDSYNQRQAVNDKIADNFSRYIRGVDEYHDPVDETSVELPGGYRNAWTNNFGEYIVSDDPNFEPNINSTINWQKMKKIE